MPTLGEFVTWTYSISSSGTGDQLCSVLVPVHFGHAELLHGFTLEVELDQHGGVVADHPSLVPPFDGDELRGLVLDYTPVREPDVDLALRHEAHVRMHT